MLSNAKSFGCTTCNEAGLFEVSWEVESFWRKLFGLKTTFKFVNYTMNKDNYKRVNLNRQRWFDEIGNPIAKQSTLAAINSVIMETMYL